MSQANVAVDPHAGIMEEKPFAIPSSKLVMWLCIISDAVTFGALLFAYGYIRNASPDWPMQAALATAIKDDADWKEF